ncbi:MAG: chlorosome envelope protein B [Chlorobiaceae bacterium]
MSNEIIDDVTGGINALSGSAGRIATQQVEMVTLAIESVAQLVGSVGKTASDLLTGTLSGVNQVLENVSSALAPEK